MVHLDQFELERDQCQFEHTVEYNLAESGVHPLTVADLLDEDAVAGLGSVRLGYSQANGTLELRERIAQLYPGADPENVLVTHGTCEANFLSILCLVERTDTVVYMLPNYLQIWGLARGLGADVRGFRLLAGRNWAPDLDEFHRAVSPNTRLVAVCNPNNPTGSILAAEHMDAIVEGARKAGAWLLADEVYQGAERTALTTPSFWGRYERTIVTNGLSKAYGAPGLRIGWVVGPKDLIARLWGYHDYTAITVSTLSDLLARAVLARRDKLLARTRQILQQNYPILENWMANHQEYFDMAPTYAGAVGYPHYRLSINSTLLGTRLRKEKSLLVVPGDFFGMDGYLRINYGAPPGYLRAGLDRLHQLAGELAQLSSR